MRKLNMFLVLGMLLTFAAHGVMGSMRLFGADAPTLKAAAWACVCFICAHIIVTSVLMLQTLRARRLSGAGYFRDNLMFWARRISGFAILIPLVMHIAVFHPSNAGAFRLSAFTTGRLISQIMLVVFIAFHVLTNIEPMLISFGVKKTKAFSHDIMLVISVVLLAAAAAFAVYYARWAAV